MIVVCDSGGCCGIKIIRNIPYTPSRRISLYDSEGHDNDEISTQPPAYENWARILKSDSMTALEALDIYIKQIKERRPAGMIVINLVDEEYDEDRDWEPDMIASAWRDVLIGRGFKAIDFINSNSENRVYHFYHVYDER